MPKILRPVGCNQNYSNAKLQLEDYANPQESYFYRLHSNWRTKIKNFAVTVKIAFKKYVKEIKNFFYLFKFLRIVSRGWLRNIKDLFVAPVAGNKRSS